MKRDTLTFGAKVNCAFAALAVVLTLTVWFGFHTSESLADSLENATGKTTRKIELAGMLDTAGAAKVVITAEAAALSSIRIHLGAEWGTPIHTLAPIPILIRIRTRRILRHRQTRRRLARRTMESTTCRRGPIGIIATNRTAITLM